MGLTRWRRLSATLSTAAAAAMILCSLPAQAGLIGVTANLQVTVRTTPDDITYAVIDNVNVPVSEGNVEFDRITASPHLGIEWTLDIRNGGFSLLGNCTSDSGQGAPQCFDSDEQVISLALTGLTWQPDSMHLVGVDITQATETYSQGNVLRDFSSSITQQILPNAMSIEFVLLGLHSLNDSVTVAGRFLAVPEPSVLSLIALGALGVPLLRLLRRPLGTRLS